MNSARIDNACSCTSLERTRTAIPARIYRLGTSAQPSLPASTTRSSLHLKVNNLWLRLIPQRRPCIPSMRVRDLLCLQLLAGPRSRSRQALTAHPATLPTSPLQLHTRPLLKSRRREWHIVQWPRSRRRNNSTPRPCRQYPQDLHPCLLHFRS